MERARFRYACIDGLVIRISPNTPPEISPDNGQTWMPWDANPEPIPKAQPLERYSARISYAWNCLKGHLQLVYRDNERVEQSQF